MLISEYNPAWVGQFNQLKEGLQKTLGDLALAIEHVGSTSVPDLAAKPIIDIDVVISGYSVFPQVTERLWGIGYFHNGNWGIEEREVFDKRKDVVWQPPLAFEHNLYVCPQDSRELQRHIAFRNQLRRNARYRREYEKIKRDIARRSHDDRQLYAKIKEQECRSFVEKVLADPG